LTGGIPIRRAIKKMGMVVVEDIRVQPDQIRRPAIQDHLCAPTQRLAAAIAVVIIPMENQGIRRQGSRMQREVRGHEFSDGPFIG
jgi:hypothetical protein